MRNEPEPRSEEEPRGNHEVDQEEWYKQIGMCRNPRDGDECTEERRGTDKMLV